MLRALSSGVDARLPGWRETGDQRVHLVVSLDLCQIAGARQDPLIGMGHMGPTRSSQCDVRPGASEPLARAGWSEHRLGISLHESEVAVT